AVGVVCLRRCLVGLLLPIQSAIRIQENALLLEASKRFLPGELLQELQARRTRAFACPFVRWLTRDWRATIEQSFAAERLESVGVLEPSSVGQLWQRYVRSSAAVGWSRIWSLFVLQRWCETMQVHP